MNFLARLHPFLIVAVLLVAIFITGVFWEAPFHSDPQGIAQIFSRAWELVSWPVQFVLGRLRGAGVDVTRVITIAVLACYVGVFVLLDIVFTKVARRNS
jgi:hypothetical protein